MSEKMKCRLCNSEFETQHLQINGRKLYLCADCLFLISEVVKDALPHVLEEAMIGFKKALPQWQL